MDSLLDFDDQGLERSSVGVVADPLLVWRLDGLEEFLFPMLVPSLSKNSLRLLTKMSLQDSIVVL